MDNYIQSFDKYVIKSCCEDMIYKLMEYFKSALSVNHVLATSYDFIYWQYYNEKRNNFNFLYCEDKHTNEILGIIGYIPNSLYDNSINKINDYIWISNWYVNPKCRGAIGIQLLNAIIKYESTENIGAIGISEFTFKICTMLKFKSSSLNHFYMTRNDIQSFKLIKNYNNHNRYDLESRNINLKFINTVNNFNYFSTDDFKTKHYFINKYEKNPFYNYYFCVIEKSLIVFRISEYNKARLLRIIDFYGNPKDLAEIYNSFQYLLSKFDCECIEFYCNGIDHEILFSSGFQLQDKNDNTIIPYHFEPFAYKNINIEYVSNGNIPKYIFKGDGDRERPGIIKI